MRSLNNKQCVIIAVVTVWLALTVTGLVYFQLGQLSPFDPNKVLNKPGWFNNFKQLIEHPQNKLATLIVVTDPDCGCTKQAEPHLKQLVRFSSEHNIAVIKIEQSQTLQTLVPATPAAVVLDEEGKFVYAGPLSEGLGCAQGSGFVETVITNLVAGFNSKLLLNDTKGCYCTDKVKD